MFKYDFAIHTKVPDINKITSRVENHFAKLGCVLDKQNPDIIFVFGGDGTLLNAIKTHLGQNCSYMMFNAGTLGFFREYDLDELNVFFKEFNYEKLEYENHRFLEIEDVYGHKTLCCNEFIAASPISTIDMNIFVNHSYLMTVKGSGLCLSTPFGSTGYNHSLGGSLVVGDSGIVLSLIAPIRNKAIHPLINSLVLMDEDEITVEVRNNVDYSISGDMRPLGCIQGNKYIIRRSKEAFKLAHSKTFDNYTRLRKSFVD